MTKHIFVTGGVVSSLGKGLTSASVGMLLERRGRQLTITLNRPEVLNAFAAVMHIEIIEALRFAATDPGSDVIVLTGSTPVLPRAFLEQLAPGGRLFAVVGEPPVMRARLVSSTTVDLFETVLAPLVNAEQASRFRF